MLTDGVQQVDMTFFSARAHETKLVPGARVIAGGVIPPQDYAFLQERGVAAIYGPGTPMLDSVRDVLNLISQHHD